MWAAIGSLFVLVIFSPYLEAVDQILTLYDESNCDDRGGWAEFEGRCADLGTCPGTIGDNRAASAKGIGAWIIYDGFNYQSTTAYVFGLSERCHNFTVPTASSIRFAGSRDLLNPAITLYSQEDFMGQEFYYYVSDEPSFSGNAASLIVTGGSSWAVYGLEDFQGAIFLRRSGI